MSQIHRLPRCLNGGILFFFILNFGFAEWTTTATAQGKKFIRVAVLKDADHFRMRIRGQFEISDPKTSQVLEEGRRGEEVTVSATVRGIRVGEQEYPLPQIRITTSRDISLWIRGKTKRYQESIDIVKDKKGRLIIVHTVDLETYMKGILYHESPKFSPMEALKAQAVTSRTYALYRMTLSAKQPFDVTSDIYSQVYGGHSAERYRTNLAVERTQGEVMIYNGEILPAYFHAACAGHTEDVSELWKQDLPPLKGVRCPYCRTSPHYHWKRNFRSKDIQDKLNAAGYRVGPIKEMKIVERNASGRIRTLVLEDRDGRTVTIAGKDFREIVGPNIVKSNNFEVVMKGYYFDLEGHGWGHGVGMCQWGAYGMAQKGFHYKEILQFYFPGVEFVGDEEIDSKGFLTRGQK